MKFTKEDAIRLAQLARLTVKSPKQMVKAYGLGVFNDFEYAGVLIENIRKSKNIILIAKEFVSYPKGSGEWLIGRALTWALEARKKEKDAKKHQREQSDAKRYRAWLKEKDQEVNGVVTTLYDSRF